MCHFQHCRKRKLRIPSSPRPRSLASVYGEKADGLGFLTNRIDSSSIPEPNCGTSVMSCSIFDILTCNSGNV